VTGIFKREKKYIKRNNTTKTKKLLFHLPLSHWFNDTTVTKTDRHTTHTGTHFKGEEVGTSTTVSRL
jgi:hypothetical protein